MTIDFDASDHLYHVDGILTPSVTQLISKIWIKGMYKGVPSSVLANKALYGSKVHELIEYWNVHKDVPEWYERKSQEGNSLRRYQQIQEKYGIEAISQEEHVAYCKDDIPLYAGSYDMVCLVNGIPDNSLIDIKTTAKFNRKYLEYQLTLYRMAYEQTTGNKINKGYCLWLPKKGRGDLIEVDFMDGDKLLKDIEKYETESFAE